MRRAGALSDEIFGALAAERFSGRTEQELAWWIERSFRDAGAEGVSFPAIVAAGETATSPHAVPGDRPIEEGVLVVVDAGCVLDGYCSDCTRTFAVGEISERLSEIYALCLEAQLAGLEAVAPGVLRKGRRRGRALADRGRRARGGVRPRARARGRDPDSRGSESADRVDRRARAGKRRLGGARDLPPG